MQTFTVTLTVRDKDGTQDTMVKEITLNQAPDLSVTSDQTGADFDDLQYIVICENEESAFIFNNTSSTKDSNVSYELDWGDGSAPFSGSSWEQLQHSYEVGIYTITYSITGPNGCKATKEYGIFVGSNPAVGLGNPGNTNVCGGQTLTFPITGTENNPPGTQYIVNYSDGTPNEVFNHPPPASVTHTFGESSCGVNSGAFPNSYSVRITAINPCSASAAVVSPIYISETPDPDFRAPQDPVCVDERITIQNQTIFGGDVSNNGTCTDLGQFVWQITPETGWELSGGSLGEQNNPNQPNSWDNGTEYIYPIFTAPGTYTVKLISGNRCGINEEVKTICVTEVPEASFETDISEGCGPITVATTNTSIIDDRCGDIATFQWLVSYSSDYCGTSANWSFADGFNQNSEAPVFQFNNAGRYTITMNVTTPCGTFSDTQEISVYNPPVVELAPVSNVCEPTTISPSATINVCHPEAATYSWSFVGGSPASSSSPSPSAVSFDTPGNKAIILEITTECGVVRDSVGFSFNIPPDISAGQDSTICYGESIALSGTANSTGNYTYQWTSSGTTPISEPNSPNPTVSPTENTTYTLLVTDNDTGCFSEDEVNVTVTPTPVIEFSIPDQTVCSGSPSEAVTINSSPGTVIEWTADYGPVTGGTDSGGATIPSQTLVNNTSEAFDVTYTAFIANVGEDVCDAPPSTYTITVIPNLAYKDSTIQICNNETFNFQPENHANGTTYTWTASFSNQVTGASDQATPSTSISQTLTNTGDSETEVIYEVTPQLNNCIGDPFLLTVNIIPTTTITFSQPDQVICSGSFSQEVSISSNIDGSGFSWTAAGEGLEGLVSSGNSDIIPAQELINPTTEPITAIYTVMSDVDSLGSCPGNVFTYSIRVNPIITLESTLSDYNGYEISCSGATDGSIDISPSGGNGDYTFEWTGPGGFTSDLPAIDGLAAGNYTLTVRDGAGCITTSDYLLEEPSGVSVTLLNTTQILCAGEATGAINIEVSGGNTSVPYSFEWLLDGEPFPVSDQNLENVPAGEYSLTVYNGENCPTSFGPITLTEPDTPMVIAYTKQDITCYGDNNGQIALDVQGGVPPYQISWEFGSSQTSFTNLGPGSYTVTVADEAGCVKTETIEIIDAPLFRITPEVRSISCAGREDGSIQLNLEQEELPYTIRWDHGAELENLFNLSAGTYGVTILMENGCEIREEFNIIEPAPLTVEPQVTDALDCDNPQSGEISLGISGGRPPYSISWSNGSTAQVLSNITAGQYEVTVQDSSGCTVTQQMEIKRPPAITVNSRRNTIVSCETGEVNEEIELFVTGGIPPYNITWSGGNAMNNGLLMSTDQSGFFIAEVTDTRGCLMTASFEIDNPPTIIDADHHSLALDEYNTHLVNFDIAFQNLSLGNIIEVFWDFGDGTSSTEDNPVHAYSSPGTYEVLLRIVDQYGCTSETLLNVEVSDYFLAIPNVFTPNGDGINDHFFPRFTLIHSLEFWVLNKWGEVIFYTDDLESEGWDGKIEGEPALPGNYIYKLNYSTLDNRSESLTDVFMLLK
ncbi:hypothetical protein GCM10028791_15860 [Echinicola sediminis]